MFFVKRKVSFWLQSFLFVLCCLVIVFLLLLRFWFVFEVINASSVLVSHTRAKDEHGFHVGQNVFHSKFGEGRIINFEGNGTDTKVQVGFARHGTKWLQLSIAKLSKI